MNAQEIDKQIDRLDERITRENSATKVEVWAKLLDAKTNFARELGCVEERIMETVNERFDKTEADSAQIKSMFDQLIVIVRKLEAKLL